MPERARTGRAMRAGMLYIVVGALLWAAIEGIGVLLANDHNPLQVVWVRYATHLLFLVALFAPSRGKALVRTTRLRLQLVRGLLMLLMPLCFLAALSLSEPEDVLGVFWIVPLLTMVLSVWLLRERVESWRWPVVLGGWIGALLILRPSSGALGLSTLPALGMALCLALYLVMTALLRDQSTLTNLVYTATCVLAPLSLLVPAVWSMPTVRTLALMAAIGLLGLGALFMFDRAIDMAPVSGVAPMLYTQPLWALVLAVVIGDDHLGKAGLLGAVLVAGVCGTLFVATEWRFGRTVTGLPVAVESTGTGR